MKVLRTDSRTTAHLIDKGKPEDFWEEYSNEKVRQN